MQEDSLTSCPAPSIPFFQMVDPSAMLPDWVTHWDALLWGTSIGASPMLCTTCTSRGEQPIKMVTNNHTRPSNAIDTLGFGPSWSSLRPTLDCRCPDFVVQTAAQAEVMGCRSWYQLYVCGHHSTLSTKSYQLGLSDCTGGLMATSCQYRSTHTWARLKSSTPPLKPTKRQYCWNAPNGPWAKSTVQIFQALALLACWGPHSE